MTEAVPASPSVKQASYEDDQVKALYSEAGAHRIPGYRPEAIAEVKHVESAELFSLEAFGGPARISLGGFLNRYNAKNQGWMRDQNYYRERAVLAAAYECMIPLVTWIAGELPARLTIDDYDTVRFLRCGQVVGKNQSKVLRTCGDVCRCPSCNKNMRLLPAKREFLPGFDKFPFWYGFGPSATNNPDTAGVHLEIGRDRDGQAIYEHLFLLGEAGSFSRLPRFSLDDRDAAQTVAFTIFDFAHWLTRKRNGVFGGIGLVGDIDFSFVRDRSQALGCNHSVLVHGHGFGNSPHLITREIAARMYDQYLKMLIKEGGGRLVAYPDIYLKRCATREELAKTINYAIKPFKLPEFYIQGLSRGCPVVGLNWEFHQVAWACERMFVGANKHLVAFGNMHVNSPRYSFERQYRSMTKKQVKEYLERLERSEVSKQETREYEQHLMAAEQRRKRKLEKQRQKLAGVLPEGTATDSSNTHAIYERED